MAKNAYVGVNNVARKCKNIYVGVNGIARKVKKVYVGANGVARQCYSAFDNPLNTDSLTLGDNTVYFKEYPDLKWQVQHLDGNYVYLSLTEITTLTDFRSSGNAYSGSTIASKCTTFLNSTIPNVAAYLESVTVNGVTAKVFIPSYKMFSGTASSGGGDANDPTFRWPKASASNRICKYQGSTKVYWLSSPDNSSRYAWTVQRNGSFYNSTASTSSYGFRPCVKVRYK